MFYSRVKTTWNLGVEAIFINIVQQHICICLFIFKIFECVHSRSLHAFNDTTHGIGMKWLQLKHSCFACFKHFKSWSTRASNVWNILWGFHAWNQNEMITLEAPMLRMFLFTFLACSYQWFLSLNHHNLMTVRHSCNYIEFMLKTISMFD